MILDIYNIYEDIYIYIERENSIKCKICWCSIMVELDSYHIITLTLRFVIDWGNNSVMLPLLMNRISWPWALSSRSYALTTTSQGDVGDFFSVNSPTLKSVIWVYLENFMPPILWPNYYYLRFKLRETSFILKDRKVREIVK